MSGTIETAISGPTRTESDSMGKIEVPADRYWGAQTERSLDPLQHRPRHHAARIDPRLRHFEKSCCPGQSGSRQIIFRKGQTHHPSRRRSDLRQAQRSFPFTRLADRRGTQTNMNINEVISNRAIEMAGGDGQQKAHPSQR